MAFARRSLGWALSCCAAAAAIGPVEAATVHVQVVDDDTERAVAARVYLRHGDEPLLPAGFAGYARGDERHFLVPGDFELELDPGSYSLTVERGLEYLPAHVDLTVPCTGTVPVRLRRWAAMNRDGWYSADMHVHRDPADVPLMLRAEDLNFVPTVTTHVWSTDVGQPWKPPSAFPVAVEPGRFFVGNAEEVERIQGGPGAVILLGRELPLPFDGSEVYPPAIAYTRPVHARGGFVEGDKPFWLDTFVNAALGELDAIEVNCNHFTPRAVETDLVPWSHWPPELGFRGHRGFALWMMDLYYRILNSGIALPLSAGTANGVKATPAGYDRVYVRLGREALDYGAFMKALKQGRSFSTNGPLLELEVDGRGGPGDRIDVRQAEEHRFHARARSRSALETLQLIVNGRVVAETRAGGAREVTLDHSLRVDRSAWAAVRAFEPSGASEVFAHTSPLYLVVGGKPVVVRESVQDLILKIDQLIAYTRRLEGFRDQRQRQETLDLYRRARQVLARRLDAAAASPQTGTPVARPRGQR